MANKKYVSGENLSRVLAKIKLALNGKADNTEATTSSPGLLSVADKKKLDGIAEGANKVTNYAGSSSAGGAASSLAGFRNTTSTGVTPDSFNTNGIGYVTGTTDIIGQNDAAMYAQAYSTQWIAQILQDYRTGQLSVRGKNNGSWSSWRKIIDSANFRTHIPAVTQSASGLMSAADKQKLDGIETVTTAEIDAAIAAIN